MNDATITRDERRKTRHEAMSRRRFLRGLGGACLALPAFPSLLPRMARAAIVGPQRGPLRMAFFMVPNGVVQKNWWPTGQGREFKLGKTMEVLEPFKDKLQIIAGLNHINATAGPDGPGDHARAGATYL